MDDNISSVIFIAFFVHTAIQIRSPLFQFSYVSSVNDEWPHFIISMFQVLGVIQMIMYLADAGLHFMGMRG